MSTTAPQATVTITGGKAALGRVPSDDAAAGMLAAVWCRSVGSAWTLELRELDRDTPLGTTRDWISSGVPISQPAPPETLARALLAEHGLHLVHDPSTDPGTHTRHGIGYVRATTAAFAPGGLGGSMSRPPGSQRPPNAAFDVMSSVSADAYPHS
ncbi:MAG: hypothetical protein ACRDRO_13420 [Pseudonocardiaceae bacterium]